MSEQKKLTLLQKAKSYPSARNPAVTQEQIELAVAWANGEVSYTQVIEALTGNRQGHTTAYSFLARALRSHIQQKNNR